MFLSLLFSSFRNFVRIIEDYLETSSSEQVERHIYWLILFRKEVLLILVYVLLAFFCKLFGFVSNDFSVTHMNFQRWLIEASFFPTILTASFLTYYVRCLCDAFDEHQTIYVMAVMLKVPVFFLMRYAECKRDFILNRLETDMVIGICKWRSELNLL